MYHILVSSAPITLYTNKNDIKIDIIFTIKTRRKWRPNLSDRFVSEICTETRGEIALGKDLYRRRIIIIKKFINTSYMSHHKSHHNHHKTHHKKTHLFSDYFFCTEFQHKIDYNTRLTMWTGVTVPEFWNDLSRSFSSLLEDDIWSLFLLNNDGTRV